jgi:hypothetical protein
VKTLLAITDLTRMQRGAVCFAGQTPEGQCIRPVLPPPGIAEQLIRAEGKTVVFPFAVVELELLKHTPQPPHVEDHIFWPDSLNFKGMLKEEQKMRVLNKSLFENVAAIFEQPIQHDMGFWVADGVGSRSLGTLQPKAIHGVQYTPGEDAGWTYRLDFTDHADQHYRLKITDLTWNYYCAAQRAAHPDPAHIAAELTRRLRDATVYLRIGLSRGWSKFPGRCFLQINGVYTLPDYLEGRTLADFI